MLITTRVPGNVLEEIVRRIVEVAQPEQIILFGSAAQTAVRELEAGAPR